MNLKSEISTGDNFTVKIDLDVQQRVLNPKIAVYVKNNLGQTLFRLYNIDSQQCLDQIAKNTSIYCHIKNIPLLPGNYYMNLWIADQFQTHDFIEHAYDLVIQEKDRVSTKKTPDSQYAGNVFVEHMWKLV